MKRILSLASVLVVAVMFSSMQPAAVQAADATAAMAAYKAVLQNTMKFYSTDDNKEYTLSEFDYWNAEDHIPLKVLRFTVITMRGDGIPKVVLELSSGFDGAFEILHYENGKVYGFNHPYRGISGLTADGIYSGSSGVDDGGFYTASIVKDSYTQETLGYSESGVDGTISYYIGKSNVTKTRYDAFLEKMLAHTRENPAVWHDLADADIASVLK